MSSSPSSAPSFSLSLSLRARVLSARSLLAFSMRRAPLFRSFSFQASSSSSFSIEDDGTFVAFFLLRVCPCTTRRGSVSSFFLSPKDSQIYSSLCPLVEREKKDKKGQRRRNEHKKERDLFFLLVGQTKKRTKKQEGKKDRITPPPARTIYISKSPILYYRHKSSSSRSVAGAKTRKRRLFSGGVDFFAGFNRARL